MQSRPSRWTTTPYSVAAADAVGRELGLSPVTAAVLARRGYDTPAAARAFLTAAERHSPWLFDGMEAAVATILEHVRRGTRIVVHGDYDVDGVCSTAVLLKALRRLGADPGWYLPSREEDGYGLSAATVERLAAQGAALIVTVDCGITAVAEVARARKLGVEVVVTDHHRPADELPGCTVLHPARGYPFPYLCGTGVAYKLAEALLERAGEDPRGADAWLDLVGLATVCDLVPLSGENRRLAREGLRELGRTRNVGLRSLLEQTGGTGQVDEHTAGFRIGPRLNAAGRIARADAALELLMTDDEGRAAEVARELDQLNLERRDEETRTLFAAEAAVAGQTHLPALVAAGAGWHPGVVGIVASRLVERHHRPAVVIAFDGHGSDSAESTQIGDSGLSGGGRGSGRSIAGFDLHAALAACSGHLSRFGGHRAAAGLELDAEALPAFREAFVRHAGSVLTPEDLKPVERVDAVAPAGLVGMELAEELQALGPFGMGNPQPTLLIPAARVAAVSPMGQDRQHVRFTVVSGGARAQAVAFRTSAGSLAEARDRPHDIAVRLERNEWNGRVEPRLLLRALCPAEPRECQVVGEEMSLDEAIPLVRGRTLSAAPLAERALLDRRAQGAAGVVGDLLSSGEDVLVACAHTGRRAGGLALLGGIAGGRLAVTSWEALAARPARAVPYPHVVALDPPPRSPAGPVAHPAGKGLLHLAWGPADVDFARACAESVDPRADLAAAYRALRAARRVGGHALATALRGAGRYPRTSLHAARLLVILDELGLVALDDEGPSCTVIAATTRTDLELSPAYRAWAGELAATRRWLAAGAPTPLPAAA